MQPNESPADPTSDKPIPQATPATPGSAGVPASPSPAPATPVLPATPAPPVASTNSSPGVHVMGRRTVAITIDSLILVVVYVIVAQFFGTHHVVHTVTTTTTTGGAVLSTNKGVNYSSGLTGLATIVLDLAVLLYFVLLEGMTGATLGKRVTGIHVRSEDGSAPDMKASLIRNVMRIVDVFPYFIPYLLGYIVGMSNDRRQRLGDKLAHTVVVKNT